MMQQLSERKSACTNLYIPLMDMSVNILDLYIPLMDTIVHLYTQTYKFVHPGP